MRRHATVVFGLAFLVLGCRELPAPDLSDNGGSGDDGALQAYTGPVAGVITGQVSTPDGEGIEGVMVDIEGIGSQITDADGMYRFDEVAPQGLLNVAFYKPGYSSNYALVELEGWETVTASAHLLPILGKRIVGLDGGRVDLHEVILDFAPGSFIDAVGAAVQGDVEVTVSYVDPTTSDLFAGPGDTRALDDAGNEAGLRSFGMAEVTLWADGQMIEVADGVSVTTEILLPDVLPESQADLVIGSQIAMWYYDEARVRWVEEGMATVVESSVEPGRLAALADLPHFTWWNVDTAFLLTCIRGKIVDVCEYPVDSAQVTVDGDDYAGTTTTTTDDNGDYVAWPVQVDALVRVNAEVVIGGDSYSASGGPFSTPSIEIPAADLIEGYVPTLADLQAQGLDLSQCAQVPTLTIAGSVVAGQVTVVRNELFGLGSGDPVGTTMAGNALFFEPPGDPEVCLDPDPVVVIPPDDCIVFPQDDPPVKLDLPLEELGVGPQVIVDDGDEAMTMWQTEHDDWDKYYETDEMPELATQRKYDVYFYGEQDGLPEASDTDSVLPMGSPVEVTYPSLENPLEVQRGQSLTLETNTQAGSKTMIVYLLPETRGGDAVICRFEDDGEMTIPAAATAAMPAGNIGVVIHRINEDKARLPTGYWARTMGITAATLIGEVVE